MTTHYITLSIPDALARITPNAEWTMTDINDYGTLVWNDNTQTKPSEYECKQMFIEIKNEKYMEMIRFKRNNLLSQTDKFMTEDYPHSTPEAKQAWKDYRIALRDLPNETEDPANPAWPVPPLELEEVFLKDEYVFNEHMNQ